MSVPGNLYTPTIRKTRGADYLIDYALALDGTADYLHWTPGGTGVSSTTWTFSCWFKETRDSVAHQDCFISCGASDNATAISTYSAGAVFDNVLNVYAYHGSPDFEKQLVRHQSDAASWYHLVVQYDSTEGTDTNRIKFYINGVRDTDFETGSLLGTDSWPTLSEATDFGTTDTIKLGVNTTFGSPHAYFFLGEIAEVIMIDGIVEDVSSFGETSNSTGEWVPVDPSGISSFGTNGFWLDFADSSHFGKDVSITPTTRVIDYNSYTGPSEIHKGDVTTLSYKITASRTANCPKIDTYALGATSGSWSGVTVRVETDNGSGTAPSGTLVDADGSVSSLSGSNGTYVTATFPNSGPALTVGTAYWVVISGTDFGCAHDVSGVGGGTLGLMQDATYYSGRSVGHKVYQVAANDFTDVSLTTASQIVSTPTDNFATINPLYPDTGSTTFSENNKTVVNTSATNGTFGLTIPTPTNDTQIYYAEFELGTVGNDANYVGVALPDWAGWGTTTQMGTSSGGALGINNAAGAIIIRYDGSYTTGTTVPVVGDAYVVAIRGLKAWVGLYDASAGNTKWIDQSGTERTTDEPALDTNPSYTFTDTEHLLVGCSVRANGGNGDLTLKCDSADWVGTPPSGAVSISTANLPAPAIPDPSDHFYSEVVTHDGTSTASTCSFDLDTYEWLCIIKNTTGAVEKWYWIDSLRGVTKYLDSTSNGTETTDANVLTVSGTTFTLGSTLGAKNYLVEFHKAGLAADTAANSEGTITTISTSVNTTSGFSISTWAGTSTNGTFGHGLTSAPEFNIVKVLGTYNWAAWHTSLTDGTYWLRLNTTAAQAVDADQWNSTVPSSTLISVGNGSGNTNITGNNSVSYSWHGVEGYSYFGAYEGNGNADGPFINSGLADGAIIVKAIDATNGWALMDKAAGLVNPHVNFLQFNSTAIGDGAALDLVSNGLKVRNTGTTTNVASTLIYCQIGGTSIKYARAR
jgi:hypothetical protein